MSRRRRCRRCGARLALEAAYCGHCGTRQEVALSWQRSAEGLAPGWYPDPFRGTGLRRFDGGSWTSDVYDGGPGTDVIALDDTQNERLSEGEWRATPGSLALSIGGLALSFGLSIVFILPLILSGHSGGVILELGLSEAGLWIGLVGTCVLASHRYGTGKVLRDFRVRFRPIDLLVGLATAVVGRGLSAIVLVPFARELRSTGNPDASIYHLTSLGWSGWLALSLLTCVGAPLIEELFFRGLLQGQLVERFGVPIGILMTSVVFGSAHIANDPGIAGLLLALSVGASGIALGSARHLTGRLGSSITGHALFNGSALVLLATVGLLLSR